MNVLSIEFSITFGTWLGVVEPYSLCFGPFDWLLEEVEVVTVFETLKLCLFRLGKVVTGILMLTSSTEFPVIACLDSGFPAKVISRPYRWFLALGLRFRK